MAVASCHKRRRRSKTGRRARVETRDAHRIRTRDGFPLTIQVSGPDDAPALLLLQGQANSHEWWDGLREDFEPALRTITFDYRGTGGSRGGLDELSTASFAADAAEVLDRGCTSPGGKNAIRRPRAVCQALGRLRGAEHIRYLFDLFYTPNWTVSPTHSKLLGDGTMTAAESAAHLRISANHDAWDRLP